MSDPFCCVHCSRDSQMLFNGLNNPKTLPNPVARSQPPSNTWFLGVTWICPQTASRSVQPFLHSTSVWPTHRQTHRQTDRQTTLCVTSVVTGCIYLLPAMWTNNIIIHCKLLWCHDFKGHSSTDWLLNKWEARLKHLILLTLRTVVTDYMTILYK